MKIIPTPKEILQREGYFYIKPETVISAESFENTFPILRLKAHIKEKCLTDCRILGKKIDGSIYFQQKSFFGDTQAYEILITESGITISAESHCGMYYGAVTLCQLIDEYGSQIPCCHIQDTCDVKARGILYDVTRGRVPKLATLKKLIQTMSYYKLNQLYLYVEHSFEYRDISEGWRGSSALSAEDILELQEFAEQYYVELVPNFASFGHLYQILHSKSYSHLAELTDVKNAYSWIDRQLHHVVDVSNPESRELIHGMLDETAPLFHSNRFNLACDETFDLGMGRSNALLEKYGKPKLYAEFVSEICRYISQKGKKPMIFGDIMKKHPEIFEEHFDDNVTIVWWNYDTRGVEGSIKLFQNIGCEMYACSGTSGWNRFVNDFRLAKENIRLICKQCKQYGLAGFINTDWGDMGGANYPELSETMYLYGAQYSWNSGADEMADVISEKVYGDSEILTLLTQLHECMQFNWADLSCWNEMKLGHTFKDTDMIKVWVTEEFMKARPFDQIEAAYENAKAISGQLRYQAAKASEEFREKYEILLNAAEAVRLSDAFLSVLRVSQFHLDGKWLVDAAKLAVEFEYWLCDYEKLWRRSYREAELRIIQETIYSVCDTLREIGFQEKVSPETVVES